ncbi:anti-anti-sigma factor [Amycolatopsis pretoriensis]|uniref:Anti-anti-sigma factor n=1 Tax=Amycolatopsis pretoriensis TaxID=218821 RepID=A0A1H5RJ35_9PSEU|nr:STAS domain-containing protein [Amycolatopsis pretoriensis]SEF38372.1 anti-anti-sigma factor [Amycolatopsis pretoriensis]
MSDRKDGARPSVESASSQAGEVLLDERDAAAVVQVAGALDLALAPKLRQLVDRAARREPRVLVLDLTQVSFLASAGMAELVRAHRSLPDVRVVADGRITRRPLELTRLTDELTLFPTLSAALERP